MEYKLKIIPGAITTFIFKSVYKSHFHSYLQEWCWSNLSDEDYALHWGVEGSHEGIKNTATSLLYIPDEAIAVAVKIRWV